MTGNLNYYKGWILGDKIFFQMPRKFINSDEITTSGGIYYRVTRVVRKYQQS